MYMLAVVPRLNDENNSAQHHNTNQHSLKRMGQKNRPLDP